MRKNWKRFGAMLLALVMVLSLVPTAALAARITDDAIAIAAPGAQEDANLAELPAQADAPAQLAEGETPAYTMANINAGLFDVGSNPTKEGDTWVKNYSSDGLTAAAGTECSTSDGNDGPASYALDENTGHWWHNNWHDKTECSKLENRWISITFSEITEIAGFRYLMRTATNGNGYVMDYEIQVQKTENGDWEKVAEGNWGHNRTTDDLCDGQWRLATFTPVSAKAVRLIGKTTSNDDTSATFMHAVAVRALKPGTVVDPTITFSGKVTSDGTTPLAGAKVELVRNNTAKSFVSGVTPATTNTDGTYSLSFSVAVAGEYCVRVSKDGHGAKLGSAVTVAAAEATETHENVDVQLAPIESETHQAKFSYDMSEGNRPQLGISTVTNHPEATYENDKLVLSFKNIDRMDNIVKLTGTGVKNGTIEFDATRTGAGNSGRFGLALRLTSSAKWIYVGSEQSSGKWFHEYWNNAPSSTGYLSSMPVSVTFGDGDTRHFKVTINEGTVEMEIDGVPIYDTDARKMIGGQSNLTNLPMDAQDVGFICGNNGTGVPSTITIDNLYIFRDDPTYTVGLSADPALTAQIVTSAHPEGEPLTNNQAAAGDTIKITASGALETGKVLGGLTVTKTGDANTTVPATFHEDESGTYFTFAMPDHAVTVTGALKNAFSAALPQNAPKEGQAYAVTLDPAGANVTYQWYRVTVNENDVAVGTNSASYTPVEADKGKTLKVVVTGTDPYAGIKTLTTPTVLPADAVITGATLQRSAITMWMNAAEDGADPDPTNTQVEGKTTNMLLTVSPTPGENQSLEPYTIEWTSSAPGVATIEAKTDTKEATLTAVANGTTTITATLTRTNAAEGAGKTITAECEVTVKTKTKSVTVKNGQTEVTEAAPLVLYTNNSVQGKPNSAELSLDLDPANASEKGFTWVRRGGAEGLITVTRKEGDNTKCTIAVTGISETNVGEKIVDVTSTLDSTVTKAFKVVVRRYLENNISFPSDASVKVGSTLEAQINQLVMTPEGKNALTYAWYRLDTAEDKLTDNNKIAGAEAQSYLLTADDFGKYIAVTVTADPTTYYEGTKTAKTSVTVAEKDGPVAPTGLAGVACTTTENSDGKISGLTPGKTYDLQKEGDTADSWVAQSPVTADDDGYLTGLTNGNYQVRVPADSINHVAAGAWSTTITIGGYQEELYTISIDGNITGGTVSTQRSSVTEGTEITITVTPDEGYELVENSLTVAKTGEAATTVAVADNKFSMPAYDVTITAQFRLKKVTITHALTGVDCSITEHTTENTHEVGWGTVTSIVLTAKPGYVLPTTVTVSPDVGYTYQNGTITFTSGVKQNITVTATATKRQLAVNYSLTAGGLTGPDNRTVEYGAEYTGVIKANTGFRLPETITVTRAKEDGSDTLVLNTDYTYNSQNGTVVIKATATTGNITITAAGVKIKTPVTGVEITIHHTDTGVTNTGVPHVGDQLTATVAPTGATVSYEWFTKATNGDWTKIGGASEMNYTVVAGDKGKWIKVKVTGTGDFSGTQEDALASAVGDPVKLPTAVAVKDAANKTSGTILEGNSTTLTATITPSDATDKTITWSVYELNADTVVTDVVRLSATTGSTVTATGLKPGTVRINARTANGLTANYQLVVDHASSTDIVAIVDDVTVTYDGQPHSITVTVTQPATGATIQYRADETEDWSDTKPTFTNVGVYTVYYKITADSYTTKTGAATVTINAAQATTYAVTVSASEHGSVTADKATAAAGDTVTLIVTPDSGYKLGTLTVKDADNGAVTVTNNAFTMPAKAVTVSATFVEDTGEQPGVNTAALESAITTAKAAMNAAVVKPENTDPATVSRGTKFVTQAVKDALNTAITTAESAKNAADKTQETVDAAVTALNDALATFNAATQEGTKASSSSSSSRPSTSTSTTTNPDGSKTTTVTDNRTGTVTATTEKADGTKEVVETKKDGTKTETVTAPDGAKTEKVTAPDKAVTITATDKDGEEIAKVEIPAEIPAPETKFEDVDDAAWAEEAIDHVAALGLMEGTGDKQYSPVAPMTRGSLATVLHRLSQGKTNYNVTFQDVAQGKYYTEGVAWAAKAGVVKGFTVDRFAPEEIITREQLAAMLARYADLIGLDTAANAGDLGAFSDGSKTGDWAAQSVAWCVKAGILQGRGNGTLAPADQVSRAEVAVMLDRFIALIQQ